MTNETSPSSSHMSFIFNQSKIRCHFGSSWATIHQIHLHLTATMSVPFDAIPHDVKQEVLGELEKEYMELEFTDAAAVAKLVAFWEFCRRIKAFVCKLRVRFLPKPLRRPVGHGAIILLFDFLTF